VQAGVFVPAAVAFNDLVLGFDVVSGATYQGGVAGELSLSDTSLVLVNRWASAEQRKGELEKGEAVVIKDPYNPKRKLIRQIKSTGKESQWVRFQNQDARYFNVFVLKGYCTIEGTSAISTGKVNVNSVNKRHATVASRSSAKAKSAAPAQVTASCEGENQDSEWDREESIDTDSDTDTDDMIFGPLSLQLIQGAPLAVLTPFKRFGLY